MDVPADRDLRTALPGEDARKYDDGYVQQRLAVDLGMLHSVDNFGLRDVQRAHARWQAALTGRIRRGYRKNSQRSSRCSTSGHVLCSRRC